MKTSRYTPENIVLAKQLLQDDSKYEQLTGDAAYKALKALGLTYVQVDEQHRVLALSSKNMDINGFYIYLRKS